VPETVEVVDVINIEDEFWRKEDVEEGCDAADALGNVLEEALEGVLDSEDELVAEGISNGVKDSEEVDGGAVEVLDVLETEVDEDEECDSEEGI
jgi:hypothetical protein